MSRGTMTNVLVRDILRANGEDPFGLLLFFAQATAGPAGSIYVHVRSSVSQLIKTE